MLTVAATLTLHHRPASANASASGGGRRRALLPACTPWLPQVRSESWVLVLTEAGGGRVLGVATAPRCEAWKAAESGGGCVWVGEFKTDAGGAGKRRMEVHAVCSAYVGADVVASATVEVQPRRRPPVREDAGARRGEGEGGSEGEGEETSDDDDDDDDDDGDDDGCCRNRRVRGLRTRFAALEADQE